MNRKRIRICGRNTSTAPAPPMMPLTSRLDSGPSGRCAAVNSPSRAMPPSIQSMGASAQLNTAWNITNMTAASTSEPAHRMQQHARRSARTSGFPAARCNPRPRAIRADRICVCSASSARGFVPRRRGNAAMMFPARRLMASMSASAPPRFTAMVGSTGTPSSVDEARHVDVHAAPSRRRPCD